MTCSLKGYSIGQSHFSEINEKSANKNKLVTHFVHKYLDTRENEQNVVINESSQVLGSRSDFGACHDNSWASGSNFVRIVVARFPLFYKQNGAYWCHFLVR